MTVIEVEQKKAQLEATVKNEFDEAKKCKAGSDDFDLHMSAYLKAKSDLSKIDSEFAKAKESEKTNLIKADCDAIGQAITQLLTGLKVADKLTEPVKSLVYVIDSEGKVQVTINKVTKLKSAGATSEGKGKGHTKIIDSAGNELSVTAFIKAHATEAELTSKAFVYPHTQADTKAKFEAFCKSHNLTGYEYRIPAKTEAEEAVTS